MEAYIIGIALIAAVLQLAGLFSRKLRQTSILFRIAEWLWLIVGVLLVVRYISLVT